jgi:hypothetical protein
MNEEPTSVWDTLPRMLWELCDGHPERGCTLYACDYPNGVRQWYCKTCYPIDVIQRLAREWRAAQQAAAPRDR